ncbi:MAG: hypothetical protein Q9227_005495 [Pyrenula ochraceoflavens]
MLHFCLLLSLATCITCVNTAWNRFPPNGLLNRREASIDPSDYPAHTISIPIDHFNASDKRTFKNRYWYNNTYYKPGGPVFYFDSGEQNAHPLVPYFLAQAAGPSAVMTLARQFGGLAVLFEHRFYGDLTQGSFPFSMNSTTGFADEGPAAYKYLNTEQALSDPVYLANHFQPPGLEDYWSSLSPQATPWIWLGGSYPGVRGAQMRVRNPETFFAAWGSSAPTQAAVDMWVYYAQAERSMTRNCSADYSAVTRYVDRILTNGSREEISDLKFALQKAIQSAPGDTSPTVNRTEAEQMTKEDVGWNLLIPLDFYQYYGFDRSVLPFCNIMETRNNTQSRTDEDEGKASTTATELGLAATYNVSVAWQAFLTALAQIDYDSIPGSDDPIAAASWTWQYCSEYGFYQRGNPENPHTIQSRFISIDAIQANCNETFPYAPSSPEVSKPNKYGGWQINPSNVMFSSGEFDPWRTYSPASTEKELGAPMRQTVQTIPACNVAPPTDQIFGIVHSDMVHVSDMRALLNTSDVNHQNFQTVGFSSPISAEPFYSGIELFSMALEQWLPCFNESRRDTSSSGGGKVAAFWGRGLAFAVVSSIALHLFT